MKIAISLPDRTFDRASRRAGELGMSRSEFFARAAEHYLEALDTVSLTGRIDEAIERLGSADESSLDAIAAGRQVLEDQGDDW